jgi:hypothetical protein
MSSFHPEALALWNESATPAMPSLNNSSSSEEVMQTNLAISGGRNTVGEVMSSDYQQPASRRSTTCSNGSNAHATFSSPSRAKAPPPDAVSSGRNQQQPHQPSQPLARLKKTATTSSLNNSDDTISQESTAAMQRALLEATEARSATGLMKFPIKLYYVLEEVEKAGFSHIFSWMPRKYWMTFYQIAERSR